MNKQERINKIKETINDLENRYFSEYNIDELIDVLKNEYREEGGNETENKNHYWSNLKEFIDETSHKYSNAVGERNKADAFNKLINEASTILRIGLRKIS